MAWWQALRVSRAVSIGQAGALLKRVCSIDLAQLYILDINGFNSPFVEKVVEMGVSTVAFNFPIHVIFWSACSYHLLEQLIVSSFLMDWLTDTPTISNLVSKMVSAIIIMEQSWIWQYLDSIRNISECDWLCIRPFLTRIAWSTQEFRTSSICWSSGGVEYQGFSSGCEKNSVSRQRIPLERLVPSDLMAKYLLVQHAQAWSNESAMKMAERNFFASRAGTISATDLPVSGQAAGRQRTHPIVFFDSLVLHHPIKLWACQNISGIANTATFRQTGMANSIHSILDFYTCPGNVFIDATMRYFTDAHDKDGDIGGAGQWIRRWWTNLS